MGMETETAALERRLAALEQTLVGARRTARIALVVAAVAGLVAVTALSQNSGVAPEETEGSAAVAPAPPVDLLVQKLTLVDEQGRARAALGLSLDGAVALTLSAPDGTPRLVLQAADQGAGLSALGPGGKNRAWLGWGYSEARGDRAELQLLDRAGRPRLSATASDAAPGLSFYNDAGVATESVPP